MSCGLIDGSGSNSRTVEISSRHNLINQRLQVERLRWRCLLFPDGIDESGFFQFLNEAGIHRIGWVEIFGAGVAKLDRFEHEFDPLHIDVRDPILKTGHRVIGRVQHLYIPILGKIGGDLQNELFVLAIKLQSFDKSLLYTRDRIAMILDVTPGAGETAARIVETELLMSMRG